MNINLNHSLKQELRQAQPPLEFIPPKLNPLVLRITQQAVPWVMGWQTAIAKIEADQVKILVDLYRQFQQGKIRFLMAFRHPNVNDPWCMAYLLWQLVPQLARQQGILLQQPIHAHFIYDRGIPLWAGEQMAWLYSRLGGTPIHRGKADWKGLRSARDLFVNSKLPMAAAPEGATNGHNEIISPLEPGIAQLGFWCVEDLLKAGRTEEVLILPIGIQYYYLEPPWHSIDKLLSELEAASGLSVYTRDLEVINQPLELNNSADQPSLELTIKSQKLLYLRLYRLSERLLSLMEEFYTRFYHKNIPQAQVDDNSQQAGSGRDANEILKVRLQALVNVALEIAEEYFDLPAKGTVIDRCRRLEQAGWDYIYREDLKNLATVSDLEKGLADRIAEEANLRMWHMRLVETFVAVTGKYVIEKPTVERFAETVLLLWDMVTRIRGNSPFQRPQLGKQRVEMKIGQPLSVSAAYPAYQSSRQGARQAVSDFTQNLQQAMEALI